MSKFIKLTDAEITEYQTYILARDIVAIAPLTEDVIHNRDYDYTQGKYDTERVFCGIKTETGIYHVAEKPDEVYKKLIEVLQDE